METRQTIITSFLTTLATIFVVAVIMHMCCGRCGERSSCPKQSSHCSASRSHCEKSSSCSKGEKSSCEKACEKEGKMCEKGGKMCKMSMGEDKEMMDKKEIVNPVVKK